MTRSATPASLAHVTPDEATQASDFHTQANAVRLVRIACPEHARDQCIAVHVARPTDRG